jgi:hypothetical protein
MSGSPIPFDAPHLLDSIIYPIDKVALLDRAREIEVPSAVADAIHRLPAGPFASREELVQAIESITQ